MNAYVKSSIQARSIQRIALALETYSPINIKIVDKKDIADFIVYIVIGSTDLLELIELDNKPFAIVQCCLLTTERPNSDFWGPLWGQAKLVWSYLNLNEFAPNHLFNFYHSPLGVDNSVFRHTNVFPTNRDVTIVTTGYVAESEGIREVSEAVRQIGGWQVHIGPDFGLGPHVTSMMDISDLQLATIYSRTKFVAGLRRTEGFELPASEGLLCGARPIMFDKSHYHQWFDEWAVFVPEDSPEIVTESIKSVLQYDELTVTQTESSAAAKFFDWKPVVNEFWNLCLQ